jgi:hypothetical protein
MQLSRAIRAYSFAVMIIRGARLSGLLIALLAGGCAGGLVADHRSTTPVPTKLTACYAYGCRATAKIVVTENVSKKFSAIMAYGAPSPDAERSAVSRAVQYFEDLSVGAIGARDLPKSPIVASGKKGQMDCIDESTNTRHVLLYLQSRGLLKHHKVLPNVSRGLFLDGRYPHWTAVLSDPSGKKWAVDSWYEPAGGPPDIVALDYWRTRGVMGER